MEETLSDWLRPAWVVDPRIPRLEPWGVRQVLNWYFNRLEASHGDPVALARELGVLGA
jgi:hypothetical protein